MFDPSRYHLVIKAQALGSQLNASYVMSTNKRHY